MSPPSLFCLLTGSLAFAPQIKNTSYHSSVVSAPALSLGSRRAAQHALSIVALSLTCSSVCQRPGAPLLAAAPNWVASVAPSRTPMRRIAPSDTFDRARLRSAAAADDDLHRHRRPAGGADDVWSCAGPVERRPHLAEDRRRLRGPDRGRARTADGWEETAVTVGSRRIDSRQ